MSEDYYKTKDSVEEYIQLAKDVNGAELIDKLKQFLTNGSTLLEVGTGPGTDWNILSKDYDVIGSDNSLEFLSHLRKENPRGTFIELDAITIETELKFDGIYSNKVLHHLKDEELLNSLVRQNEILNEGGIICHSFWEGEGSEVFKGLYVNYHSPDELTVLFSPYFELLLLGSYEEFEAGDSILLIGRKKPQNHKL